jgi:cell division protease FtsH
MLDKGPKDTKSTPTRGILQFLGFDNDPDKTKPTSRNQPKEPEERKHQFATWYIFAAFLGLMLIQYAWLQYTRIETIAYSQFEQLVDQNKTLGKRVGARNPGSTGAPDRSRRRRPATARA